MLAALGHPNVAAIHHVEETRDGPALVMELVDGETLAGRGADADRHAIEELSRDGATPSNNADRSVLAATPSLVVIQSWQEELKRLVRRN